MITTLESKVVQSETLMNYIRDLGRKLHTRYTRVFKDKEEWLSHREETVLKLRKSLGLEYWPERNPLNARLVGKVEREDCVVEKVVYESRPDFLVNALVYVPKNSEFPAPAVVSPIGHWDPLNMYQPEVQLRCIGLAKRGFITLTYDPIGQGERAWLGQPYWTSMKHEDIRRQAKLCGHSLSAMMFWDTMRAIDYLYARPDVRKDGVGCVGVSGGGFNTLYSSVLDERIKVSIPICYATNFAMLIERGSAGCCAYIPNLAIYAEIDDIYSLIAPRPLLILAGGETDHWLSGGAQKNFEVAKVAYSLFEDGLDRLRVFRDPDAGHTISKPMREQMYYWFNKWLKDDTNPEHALEEEPLPGLFSFEAKKLQVLIDRNRGRTTLEVNREVANTFMCDWELPKTREEFIHYKALLQRHLVELLGDVRLPPDAVHVEEVYLEKQTSTETLRLTTEPNITLMGDLSVPNGEVKGVVLYIRTDKVLSDLKPIRETISEFFNRGFAVFNFRVRGTWETSYGSDISVDLYAMALGKNIFATRVYDLICALDYIKSRKDLKACPVICLGEGLREGLTASYLASIDDRVSSLMINRGLMGYRFCLDEGLSLPYDFFTLHILRYADLPQILSTLAPRKICVMNPASIKCIQDTASSTPQWQEGRVLSREEVEKTYSWTMRVYELMEANRNFRLTIGQVPYGNLIEWLMET